jgi:hypothetical protein
LAHGVVNLTPDRSHTGGEVIYTQQTTCAEIVDAWDKGDAVWSVEMGGLGPGYEQAIQVLAVECMRELVRVDFQWTGKQPKDTDAARALLDPVVDRVNQWPGMGFSGAQVGAAMGIACKFHHYGPLHMLNRAAESRRIQISKTWPASSAPEGK